MSNFPPLEGRGSPASADSDVKIQKMQEMVGRKNVSDIDLRGGKVISIDLQAFLSGKSPAINDAPTGNKLNENQEQHANAVMLRAGEVLLNFQTLMNALEKARSEPQSQTVEGGHGAELQNREKMKGFPIDNLKDMKQFTLTLPNNEKITFTNVTEDVLKEFIIQINNAKEEIKDQSSTEKKPQQEVKAEDTGAKKRQSLQSPEKTDLSRVRTDETQKDSKKRSREQSEEMLMKQNTADKTAEQRTKKERELKKQKVEQEELNKENLKSDLSKEAIKGRDLNMTQNSKETK